MPQTVTCPNCNTLLRSDRIIPAGAGLRCPGCRSSFTAPRPAPAEPELSLTASDPLSISDRPSPFGAPFVIAISVSLVLGLSIVTAAVLFVVRSPGQPATVVQDVAREERKADDDRRLDEERKKVAAAQAQLEEQKRKLEHARLIAKADLALNKNDFAEAEKLYSQALDLLPTDADTVKGLVAARSGAQAAKKTDETDKKRQQEVERLVTDGRKSIADKRFAAAVRALESARALDPSDKTVREALDEARTALDNDQTEKKRLADFQARLDAGKTAMKAERFGDAVKEFQAAARLMPDDLDAAQLVKQAENKLINLADRDKRQAAFANLLERARTAQAATRYNEALQASEAALRLIPNDRDGERAARDARAALKKAKSDNATRLAQADEAAKLGRIDEARQILQDASKAWAEDTQADKALRNLDRLVDNARTSQLGYARAIQQAEAAILARDWAAAVAAYTAAGRLNALDEEAARQLAVAQSRLKREVGRRVDYDQYLKRSRSAMTREAYGDAITALNAALRIAPDPDAVVAIKADLIKARYGKAMAEGKLALQQRRRGDAIAAFKAALDEKPDDPVASAYKRQAESLRTTDKAKGK